MNPSKLRQLQLSLLEILVAVDKICKQNGISYFIDSGTLLGAVRHKGFIPWDDDIDIGMTRSNYEVFLQKAREQLPSCFFIQDWSNDAHYDNPFAKVYKKNTRYIEKNGNHIEKHEGIFIDVFPYDNLPEKVSKAKRLGNRLSIIRRLVFCKCNHYKCYPLIIRLCSRLISLFLNKSHLIRRYNRIAQTANSKYCKCMYAHTGNAKLCTWVVSTESIANTVPMQFEGICVSAPEGWDDYLTSVYGDYRKMPDPDKQVAPHVIDLEV